MVVFITQGEAFVNYLKLQFLPNNNQEFEMANNDIVRSTEKQLLLKLKYFD